MNFKRLIIVYLLILLATFSVIQITEAITLGTCQSTKNAQPCQCQGTTSYSNGCYCKSSGYTSNPMSCTDTTPPITCASQCGNGAVRENSGLAYSFLIDQRGLTNATKCPDCDSDTDMAFKTCYEICDTGPGTMGLYVGPSATTCCPRNCGWDGVTTNTAGWPSLGTPTRSIGATFDRFNIVPLQCYTTADCPSAPGWTVTCRYYGDFGWCGYFPGSTTFSKFNGQTTGTICPTLPCYDTLVESISLHCLTNNRNNNIDLVYNTGTTYGRTNEKNFYCYKNSSYCWNTPSCNSGTLVATPVIRVLSGYSATATVNCNTSIAVSTFVGTLTLDIAGATINTNSFNIYSTTCPGSVVISGTTITFTGTGASSCTVSMSVNTSCFQKINFTKSVIIKCCGDGLVTSGEACDSGNYNGYVYNSSCCVNCNRTGAVSGTSVITAKSCSNAGVCDDSNINTIDSCVLNWCAHSPVTINLTPATLCSSNPCVEYPCNPSICIQGNTTTNTNTKCIYNTSADNLASLSLTQCKSESACGHSITCNTNIFGQASYTSFITPTFTLNAVTVPTQRCGSPALPITSISQLVWTNVNPRWGAPNITYLMTVRNCPLTPVITSGSIPTLSFVGPWVPITGLFPNSCEVTIQATSSCGLQYSNSIIFNVPVECCGDGISQAGSESCDLGALNGKFLSCCSSNCSFTPGAQCRLASGSCDGGAFCPLSSTVCPANSPLPSTTTCFTAYNNCTVTRTCDGISTACPSGFKPLGASCDLDSNLCTSDTCNGSGNCTAGPLLSYDDGQWCNGPEGCNPLTGLVIPGIPPNCIDSTSCTDDSCDENADKCVHTPVANSTGPCGVSNVGECRLGNFTCDGSSPTPVITCVGAVYPTAEICVPGTKDENCDGHIDEGCTTVGCFTDSDCGNITVPQCKVAFCNASNVCDLRLKPIGSSCNDGLGCTSGDACDAVGHCGGTPIVCPNNGNSCVRPYCVEPLGTCAFDLSFYSGSSCACGTTSCLYNCTCNTQGQCANGIPVTCPSTGNQCTNSYCDTLDGQCKVQNILGTCNDGLDCTKFDTCINASCVGVHVNIDDGISCTQDSCIEPGGVITHTLIAGYCFIDNICYIQGTVNPSNPCLLCNASIAMDSWSFTHTDNVPCNDGKRCTINDRCRLVSQTCAGDPIDCSSFANDCNTASCNEVSGSCDLIPLANGTPCPSNLFCTVDRQCQSGVCSPGQPRNCSSYDSQCTIGTCSEEVQQCIAFPLPDYTQCFLNNNVCDGNEHCFTGSCQLGTPPVPPPNGDCYHYECDPDLGFLRVNDVGKPCVDQSDCTQNNTCTIDGVCDSGVLIDCNDHDPCTDDTCLVQGGCQHTRIANCQACTTAADCSNQTCHITSCNALNQCEYTPDPEGTPCPDANLCDGSEICGATGTCHEVNPLNCTTTNPCMDGHCDTQSGCYEIPNPFNVPTSLDPCLINGRCDTNGNAVFDPYPCPPPDSCHVYSCHNINNQAVCVATILVNNTCNDGDDCTIGDKCNIVGQCAGDPIQCRAPTQCEVSVDCSSGNCVPVYKAYGSPCNNGNLCFENICDGQGFCDIGNPLVVCEPIGDCYGQGECVPNLGVCTTPLLADGTACPSVNPCDLVSKCVQGHCNPQITIACPSNNQCELNGFCNRTTGQCENPPVPDNTPCTTTNACASQSVCSNKQCVDTDFIKCNSSNVCIDYTCDPLSGCVPNFNQNPCDGHNKCFLNFQCVNGICPSTTDFPVDCNDNDPCTQDDCYSQIGCVHTPIAECYACTLNATNFGGAPECPPIPCKKAYCGADHTCYYVNDDTYLQGCIDTIFCNGQERCSNGQCLRGVPPSCDDANGCTIDDCNTTLDRCTNVPNTGLQCGLPDMCVYSAQCSNQGNCVPVDSVNCSPSTDQCKVLAGCNSTSGQCDYVDAVDGTSCVSSNPCALQSECKRGICEDVSLKQCFSIDQCHFPGQCDPLTGNCSTPAKPDNAPCDDKRNCTVGDSCQNAQCQPGPFSYCDNIVHDPQCQLVVCTDGANGAHCSIVDLDGETCDDGLPNGVCTKRKVCSAGRCIREYDVGHECRAARDDCDMAELCGYADDCPPDLLRSNGHPCPDNLYCFDSTCQNGYCLPTLPIAVPPTGSPCTQFVCDETQKAFIQTNVPDGIICNSGVIGQCTDHYQCATGNCVLVPSPSTKSCSDGNNCTIGDKCSGVSDVCVAGTQKDCSFLNTQCSTGVCNAPSGTCSLQAANENGPCNADNNPCTPLDTCHDKVCVPGPLKNCTYLDSNCGFGTCRVINTTYGECFLNTTNDLCNPDSCNGGCVLSFGFWSTHSCNARPKGLKTPWPFNRETTQICGESWYEWSQKPSGNNAWLKLFDQWLGASLNRNIGACMSTSVKNIYDAATILLNKCNTEIKVSTLASALYKKYAAVLEAYNSGTMSPISCTSNYISNNIRDAPDETVDTTYPISDLFQNSVQPEDCINGVYNFLTSICECYYGWGGPFCSDCGTPNNLDNSFLCVPTSTGNPPYLLQSIATDVLDQYLTKSLPVLQISPLTPVYPNSNGLDCSCAPIADPGVQARDTIITIFSTQDTEAIISFLQEGFGALQTLFNTELTIVNNCTNDTIIVEVSTEDDDDDWNFVDNLWWIIPLIALATVVIIILLIHLMTAREPEVIIAQTIQTTETRTPVFHHKYQGMYSPQNHKHD